MNDRRFVQRPHSDTPLLQYPLICLWFNVFVNNEYFFYLIQSIQLWNLLWNSLFYINKENFFFITIKAPKMGGWWSEEIFSDYRYSEHSYYLPRFTPIINDFFHSNVELKTGLANPHPRLRLRPSYTSLNVCCARLLVCLWAEDREGVRSEAKGGGTGREKKPGQRGSCRGERYCKTDFRSVTDWLMVVEVTANFLSQNLWHLGNVELLMM